LTKNKQELEIERELASKRLIFTDLYPTMIQGQKLKPPEESNSLKNIKGSSFPGNNVLRLMQDRIKQIITTGYPIDITLKGLNQPTQLGNALSNLESVAGLLKIIYNQIENEQPIDNYLFDQFIFTITMAAYQAGGHDQSINLGEHACDGFDYKEVNPTSGGNAKAKKGDLVRNLVNLMENTIKTNSKIGKVTNPKLAESISDVIFSFSSEENNRDLQALKYFRDKTPATEVVLKWLRKNKVSHNFSADLPSLDLKDIMLLLQKLFPAERIYQELTKSDFQ
jgi:hypothetical protein